MRHALFLYFCMLHFLVIYDQMLRADRCAQAAGVALVIIDIRKILLHMNGIALTDLDTQAAANAACAAATDGHRTLCL